MRNKLIIVALIIIAFQHPTAFAQTNYFAGGTGASTAGTGASSSVSATGIGWSSQISGTSGYFNTSVGASSMLSMTKGNSNSAYGALSLEGVTQGNNNVGVGYLAGKVMSTASNNTAVGTGAMQNATSSNNSALGFQALYNSTSSGSNEALGYQALYNNLGGSLNVGVGAYSLFTNKDGGQNTGVGYKALYQNTAGANTAVGYLAGSNNSSGGPITAVGFQALTANTVGINNDAFGSFAMQSNVNGSDNTAVGFGALSANIDGIGNISIGSGTLPTAVHDVGNVSIGYQSLFFQNYYPSGPSYYADNTALGTSAGKYGQYHQFCTFLGASAGITGTGANTYPGLYNATSVGWDAQVSTDNTIVLGNSTITSLQCVVNVTATSDKRVKKDIKENVPGLDFIKQLRPVTYHYDIHTMDKLIYGDKVQEFETKAAKSIDEKEAIQYTGFLAQDVEAAAEKLNYDFSGVKKPKNDNDMYGLAYAEFVVPLVKGMQEQQKMIEDQANTIQNLSAKLETLSAQLNDIKECCSSSMNASGYTPATTDQPQLLNATPNPASNSTQISYYLPTGTTYAAIKLTNISGQEIRTYALTSTGYSTISVDLSGLSNNGYQYSLIVNGKLIGSKQLTVVAK